MFPLRGVVQNYAWGHPSFIADLLGTERGEPQAEYWLGDHPRGPASVGDGRMLPELLASNEGLLGPSTVERFGNRLPFLLKILAAAKPLSIQCHPSKDQAEQGFARENSLGVPNGDPTRTYRDDNHKPELICAVTEFEGKVGFRPVDETAEILRCFDSPSLEPIVSLLDQPGGESERILTVLQWLLTADESTVAQLVAEVVVAARSVVGLAPDATTERIARWTIIIDQHFPGDVGVVVALLLNHVVLAPGQAIGLPAGNLHCYLQGVGVELMANSDNVIRGGMTPKHVDTAELLAVVDTASMVPVVDTPGNETWYRYSTPAAEFVLERIVKADRNRSDTTHPAIWLATAGRFELTCPSGPRQTLRSGHACFVPPGRRVEVSGEGVCWRATVGS